MIIKYSLLLLFLSLGKICIAIPVWHTTSFGPKDNLPNKHVRDIAESDDGIVYLATWGLGVWVIQPKVWLTNKLDADSKYNAVRAIELDRHNRLWVGSSLGLYVHQEGQNISIEQGSEDSNSIHCIQLLQDGTIVVAAKGYIYLYDSTYNTMEDVIESKTVFMDTDTSNGHTVHKVMQLLDGSVWSIVENIGSLCYTDGQWIRFGDSNPFLTEAIDIIEDTNGTLWILTPTRLFNYDFQVWTPYEHNIPNPRTIVQYDRDSFFIGSNHGIWYGAYNNWNQFNLQNRKNDPYVSELFHSSDGSILVGTQQGLIRIYQSGWDIMTHNDSNEIFHPEAVSLDSNNPPLAIDNEGKIVEFQQEQWVPLIEINKSETARSISRDESNNIWVMFETEILVIDSVTLKSTRNIALPESVDPYLLLVEQYGKKCFVSKQELFVINENDQVDLIWQGNGSVIQTVYQSDDKNIWIGLENNVVLYNGESVESPNFYHEDFLLEKVMAINQTADGSVWLGTSADGIFVFGNDEIEHFTFSNGPLGSIISSIYNSNDGVIWVGSIDHNISSYKDNHWIHYTEEDGILPGQFLDIGEYPNGEIWFVEDSSKVKTMMRYRPNKLEPETQIDTAPNELSSNTNGVISFIANDNWQNTSREKLVYSWQLESESTNEIVLPWSQFSKENILQLPLLSPGKYQLKARAMNRNRMVDSTPDQVSFTVYGPVWTRTSFYLPVTLLFIISFTLLLQVIKRNRMIQHMAFHDSLTGLPNRVLFMALANRALTYVQRKTQMAAVIYLDLDGFKEINDNYGHQAGDLVLQMFAERIQSSLRQSDTVARFGGDEFVILAQGFESLDHIDILCNKIHSIFDQPFNHKNNSFTLGTSIGVSIYPNQAEDIDTLLKLADDAMYQNKKSKPKK